MAGRGGVRPREDIPVRHTWRGRAIAAVISGGVVVAIVSVSGMAARELAVLGLVIGQLAVADQLDHRR